MPKGLLPGVAVRRKTVEWGGGDRVAAMRLMRCHGAGACRVQSDPAPEERPLQGLGAPGPCRARLARGLVHLVFGTCGAGKGGGASALLVVPQLPQYGAKHVRNLRKEPQELSPAGRSK